MIGAYDVKDIGRLGDSTLASNLKEGYESRSHDMTYYGKCLIGGMVSSSIRWVLTPLDAVKCNMQVNPTKYPNFSTGISLFVREQGFLGVYRGLLPTVLAYSSQTGTKYMMYEVLKDSASTVLGTDQAHKYRSVIYVASAGCAEAIADVFMCPWEMMKVRVQTTPEFPSRFFPALAAMIRQREALGFPFGSLGPLWSRQILGTMANFLAFENTAEGYVSGFLSTAVSHPADSLISLKARLPHKSFREIISEVGWKALSTKGFGTRVAITGPIIGIQWFVYDSFKVAMGMGTTGGK